MTSLRLRLIQKSNHLLFTISTFLDIFKHKASSKKKHQYLCIQRSKKSKIMKNLDKCVALYHKCIFQININYDLILVSLIKNLENSEKMPTRREHCLLIWRKLVSNEIGQDKAIEGNQRKNRIERMKFTRKAKNTIN